MIVRYSQILYLNKFFKKYNEVSHVLLKFKFFNDLLGSGNLSFKFLNLDFFFKNKKMYLNFIYFYFVIFNSRYLVKDAFFGNYLFINFHKFKQFFFFLLCVKNCGESIVVFDINSFNFVSKNLISNKKFNNLDVVFNYLLISKKVKVFLFLDKKVYNYFKVNYYDLDIVVLYFPFTSDKVSKYFLNNLLYKMF